jgi:hypothetical protein
MHTFRTSGLFACHLIFSSHSLKKYILKTVQGIDWIITFLFNDINEIIHSSGSEWGPLAGSCEYGNEPSGSTKCWELLE